MDDHDLETLLLDVRSGAVAPDAAVAQLRRLPFADLGFARVDHHRGLRQGFPEAVYAPGKTPGQCAAIVGELLENGTGPVLLTRADTAQMDATLLRCPGAEVTPAEAVPGRLATLSWRHAPRREHRVIVVTAGTADLAVAEECTATLRAYGYRPKLLADCGVAGVHRLLACYDDLIGADAVVVIAGMEGALASVVGGLTPAPLVAVPTSVGYGAGLEGVTALLAMHASCAAGVAVVGIDNGYGAACAVARMLR
jgi:pyridinium-3,5-biscarboxylic acid mononucleotide synthase